LLLERAEPRLELRFVLQGNTGIRQRILAHAALPDPHEVWVHRIELHIVRKRKIRRARLKRPCTKPLFDRVSMRRGLLYDVQGDGVAWRSL
jgi:hypothetical protein